MLYCRALGDDDMIRRKTTMQQTIANIYGVELVVACVTGTQSNQKKKEQVAKKCTRIGIAFFIVMKSEAVEDQVSKAIYKSGKPDDFNYIKPRCRSRESKEMALRALCTVVKVIHYFVIMRLKLTLHKISGSGKGKSEIKKKIEYLHFIWFSKILQYQRRFSRKFLRGWLFFITVF